MEEFERSLRRPFFYDMIMDNKDIYFSMMQYNALCRASLTDDQIEIINTFPDISAYTWRGYVGVFKIKERLLFSSADKEDDLLIYDISSEKFSKIKNNKKLSFYSWQVFDYKENFYIVSTDTAEVIKIELRGLTIHSFNNYENILEGAQTGMPVRVGNRIYIPVNSKKILLVFDLEKEEYMSYPFPCNISKIYTLNHYDSRFFISGLDRQIYAWNILDNKAERIASIPDNVKSFYLGDVSFSHGLIYNGILYLFPCFADAILKINIFTGNVGILDIPGEEESAEEIKWQLKNGRCYPAKYSLVQSRDKKVFFRSSKTRLLYELDLETNELIKHDFKTTNIYQNKIYPPAINGIFSENYYMDGLRILIENLEEKIMDITGDLGQKVGEIIYKTVNG